MPEPGQRSDRPFLALNNRLRLEIGLAEFGPIAGMRWTNRIPQNRIFVVGRLPPGCRDGGTIRNAGRRGSPTMPLRLGRVYFMPCHEEIEGWFRPGGLSLTGFHFNLEAFPGFDVFTGSTALRELAGQEAAVAELSGFAGRELALGDIVRVRGLVLALAALFVQRGLGELDRLAAMRGRWQAVFDAIEQPEPARLTVDELARRMGLRRERLSRAFARDLGLPLKAFLIRQLTARACELLAAGDEPIGGVGRALGFSSVGYFSRFFRERTGITPLRYRRMRHRWHGSG